MQSVWKVTSSDNAGIRVFARDIYLENTVSRMSLQYYTNIESVLVNACVSNIRNAIREYYYLVTRYDMLKNLTVPSLL